MPDFIPPVEELLFAFNVTHKWSCFGKDVVYDLFTIGVDEEIATRTSGLDNRAQGIAVNILSITHALRSVGGYDFKNEFQEKLKFVRAMSPPIFDFFISELQSAKIKQLEIFKKRQEELKKSSPDQT